MLSGTPETSVLQVIQPGRPTLNIVLPISPAAGCNVVIRRCVVSAPVRDEVSFDVHMSNVKADFFLRYSAQGMLTEASQLLRDEKQQQALGQATQLLNDKYEDPVAATVGAYGLLKFGNNDRRDWIKNLCNDFSWLPDGAAIEAECLAREGKNEESLRTFLKLADRGIPLFTDGLIFAVDRLESFTRAGSSGAPNEEIKRARSLLELLRTYCQFLDLNKQISRYTGRMPHLPSAEPASVPPELEKDGTVLSLTLEGGDEGVVRIKPRSKPAVRRRSARAVEAAEVKSLSVSDNQPERSEAVANLIQANDPQSIALRVLHLASQSAETDVIADNVDENAVLERIVNVSPALGIEFLELGKLAARTVARVNAGSSFGTGFMVSPSLLLTTNRILPEPDIAAKTTVDFDYELTAGELKQPHTFKLEPDRFFLTNAKLDFTLVHVADRSTDLVPLSDFGFNRLNGELGKILCGESINIVHYPGGGLKSVLLRSGVLRDYVDNFLHYEAATSAGSLGAPIFNDQWEVIGLHHAAVSVGGKPTNEGMRTSSILRACREAFLPDPAMQELLDQVFNSPDVVVSSSPNQPEPLPLVPEKPPEVTPEAKDPRGQRRT
jgi:V8-like Glu-specific endopeptidase